MNRTQFEHVVRAAGAILDRREILVIGSQAIHASVTSLPHAAERSVEVDVAVVGDADGRCADLIDGAIGELSMFQETFGYYAQGVSETTAVLPDGWRARLVPFETPATNGVRALCLELHDLWISKAVAGREKDAEFCAALIENGRVERGILSARIDSLSEVDPRAIERVRAWAMR